MTPSLLEQFLVTELFTFLLIFCRVGTGIMTLPGFGEAYVPIMVRLLFALMFSLLLVPTLKELMPPVPGSPSTLTVMILAEFFAGLFIGFLARMVIVSLHMAGSIISNQASLSLATIFDISQSGQSTLIGNFLTLMSVVLFFLTDMHHVMLQGLADSYTLFAPGQFPIMQDMADHATQLLSKSFRVAFQLSGPHIIFALIFYLASGVISRLMPTMNVFFVMVPPQIIIAFFLLLATLNTFMIYYTDFVEEELRAFLDHEF